MPVLAPSEYDINYFAGGNLTAHDAGYTNYSRMEYRHKGSHNVPIEDSTGTIYGDLCKSLDIKLNSRFVGKSLLVLGCAYGFEVKGFRDLGINADGIDVSPYAISQADPSIASYLTVADARTYLPTLRRNEYDYIFSRGFMECMSDVDLITLLPEIGRVCKNDQIHLMTSSAPPAYYNIKTLPEWLLRDFTVGTILVMDDDFDNYVTKIN